jgi:predicted negative regulator of RcsB-dependent stress response
LAALLIEEKAYDEARKQLTAKTPEAFAPLMADRLGDLAMLQSQPAEAVQQYKNAWKGLEPSAEYRRLVAVKLAALGADPEDKPRAETNK